MNIGYQQLMALPANSIFYELDLPTLPVFVKVRNSSGKFQDIVVHTLQVDNDRCSRLGLHEMDEGTKRSKRWCWCSEEEINTMIGRLMLAQPAPKETA